MDEHNPKTLIFNNFNKSDGLQDDEFNTNSYHRGKSGNLYFGGVNGVNIFKASAIQQDKKQPIAKIIGLKVNNETIEPNEQSKIAKEAVEYLSELHLAHDQNLVTIEFGLMDFANPVKNRFRYQLEGIDSKWIESGTNRFANYTHLSAGSYSSARKTKKKWLRNRPSFENDCEFAPTSSQLKTYRSKPQTLLVTNIGPGERSYNKDRSIGSVTSMDRRIRKPRICARREKETMSVC